MSFLQSSGDIAFIGAQVKNCMCENQHTHTIKCKFRFKFNESCHTCLSQSKIPTWIKKILNFPVILEKEKYQYKKQKIYHHLHIIIITLENNQF